LKLPRVYGNVTIRRDNGRLLAEARLELEDGTFRVGDRLIEASGKRVNVSYSFELDPNKYYYPLISPLPVPINPYSLIDYAVVYTLEDPRYNIVHTPNDSTTVISSTKYVMSEGPAYSQVYVYTGEPRITDVDEALWAYPITPSDRCLRLLVELEYRLLCEGVSNPTLSALRAYCSTCRDVYESRASAILKRAAFEVSELARSMGVELQPEDLQPLDVRILDEGSIVVKGSGVVNICVDCNGQRYMLSRSVTGEVLWRLEEGCRVVGFSHFCSCL